mmetsp:Transcript_62904/g.130750  ORF Transcript_62904/g.130750 Transcript_62904/m.130750 type:complete len:275 (-) Transcript_62904:103-927(-)
MAQEQQKMAQEQQKMAQEQQRMAQEQQKIWRVVRRLDDDKGDDFERTVRANPQVFLRDFVDPQTRFRCVRMNNQRDIFVLNDLVKGTEAIVSDQMKKVVGKSIVTLDGKVSKVSTLEVDIVYAGSPLGYRNGISFQLLSGEAKYRISEPRVLAKAIFQALHLPLLLREVSRKQQRMPARQTKSDWRTELNSLPVLMCIVASKVEDGMLEVCGEMMPLCLHDLEAPVCVGHDVKQAERLCTLIESHLPGTFMVLDEPDIVNAPTNLVSSYREVCS